MAKVCGICKQPMRKGERLKNHARDYHPIQFRAIQKWLGATDAKIASAELLAKEGMKGPGATEAEPRATWEGK